MRVPRTFRSRALVLAVVPLFLVAAACGGDDNGTDEDTSTTVVAEQVDVQSFCEDAARAQANSQGPGASATEDEQEAFNAQATEVLDRLQANAPTEVEPDLQVIIDTVRGAMASGDNSFVYDPEFTQADRELDAFMLSNCDVRQYTVTANSQGYQFPVDGVQSGLVAFTLEPEDEAHELLLLSLRDDVTESVDEVLALPPDQGQAKTVFHGRAAAVPGESDTVFALLNEGQYFIIDTLPAGTQSLDQPPEPGLPRFIQGVKHVFEVSA